jgi:hypothetical protein
MEEVVRGGSALCGGGVLTQKDKAEGGGWHSAASDGSHSVAAWAAVVTPALRSVGERKTARW